MANEFAVLLSRERDSECTGLAQDINNEVFGLRRVRCVEERSVPVDLAARERISQDALFGLLHFRAHPGPYCLQPICKPRCHRGAAAVADALGEFFPHPVVKERVAFERRAEVSIAGRDDDLARTAGGAFEYPLPVDAVAERVVE